MVTVADTVPAGGVAVAKLPHTGVVGVQDAVTGVVVAPATRAVVASTTTATVPATRASASPDVASLLSRRFGRGGWFGSACTDSDAPRSESATRDDAGRNAERNEPIGSTLPLADIPIRTNRWPARIPRSIVSIAYGKLKHPPMNGNDVHAV
jgi:hypothetical protein